jgi:hypothetical protein
VAITHFPLPTFPESLQWPEAMSSLTVARQRGIHTRFPVFAERQRRALQTILAISKISYNRPTNLMDGNKEVKSNW